MEKFFSVLSWVLTGGGVVLLAAAAVYFLLARRWHGDGCVRAPRVCLPGGILCAVFSVICLYAVTERDDRPVACAIGCVGFAAACVLVVRSARRVYFTADGAAVRRLFARPIVFSFASLAAVNAVADRLFFRTADGKVFALGEGARDLSPFLRALAAARPDLRDALSAWKTRDAALCEKAGRARALLTVGLLLAATLALFGVFLLPGSTGAFTVCAAVFAACGVGVCVFCAVRLRKR